MKNIQNVTLSDMIQLAKLYMVNGIKCVLAQKWHDLMDCKRLCLQQGMSQLLYLT